MRVLITKCVKVPLVPPEEFLFSVQSCLELEAGSLACHANIDADAKFVPPPEISGLVYIPALRDQALPPLV